jgi:hypothetical protein
VSSILFSGGPIVTCEAGAPEPQALLVEGEWIAAVGAMEEVESRRGRELGDELRRMGLPGRMRAASSRSRRIPDRSAARDRPRRPLSATTFSSIGENDV